MLSYMFVCVCVCARVKEKEKYKFLVYLPSHYSSCVHTSVFFSYMVEIRRIMYVFFMILLLLVNIIQWQYTIRLELTCFCDEYYNIRLFRFSSSSFFILCYSNNIICDLNKTTEVEQ